MVMIAMIVMTEKNRKENDQEEKVNETGKNSEGEEEE